jgi:peptide/nickel transport system substrate-binding protein
VVRLRPAGAAAAAGLLAAVSVTGCGGDDARSSPSGPIPAYDINPMPRDRLREGGTLRMAIGDWPTQWNSNHVLGAKEGLSTVLGGLLPRSHRTDERGVPRPDPDYVVRAEVTDRRPRQVVTYTLNRDARWSDGRPITWRDYAAQARALSGRADGYQIVSSTGYSIIQRVERGDDDYEFTVTFSRPFGDWPALFSPLYPASTNSGAGVFNNRWRNRIPVTAGPFAVERLDLTGKTVSIVRDRSWWGPPAKLDRIEFRAMDHGAAPGAYANGELDVLDIGADAAAYRRARAVRGSVIRKAAGPDWRHFTFNGTSPILRDLRVRKAIAMGISREAIARSDLEDLDWPVRPLGNHFLVNTQAGYADVSGEVGRFDPGKAARLLAAAGWKRAGRYRYRDGRILRLRFVIPAGVAIAKQEGELVQAMLEEIGVLVAIETAPIDDFLDKHVNVGNFDIVPFSWMGTAYPVSSAKSIFVRPRGSDIQQNYARIGTPEIDRALAAATRELDPDEAREKTNAADRLIWQQVHTLALYQRPQLVATRAGLANFGAFGMYQPAYHDIGYVR